MAGRAGLSLDVLTYWLCESGQTPDLSASRIYCCNMKSWHALSLRGAGRMRGLWLAGGPGCRRCLGAQGLGLAIEVGPLPALSPERAATFPALVLG